MGESLWGYAVKKKKTIEWNVPGSSAHSNDQMAKAHMASSGPRRPDPHSQGTLIGKSKK